MTGLESEWLSLENRLNLWAACLGWNGLERWESPDDEMPFVWYESGITTGRSDHFAFHINVGRMPRDECRAAVYAVRYRLVSGWHDFTLYHTESEIAGEAQRSAAWLHKDCFLSLAKRREYRMNHPECAGYSWKRIREERPDQLGKSG